MLQRLLIGTALSGLLVPVLAQAESAALGPVPSTSSLQHPAQLAPSASSQFSPFQPRISVNGALGSDRSLAITEGWAPLWQDEFNVFYGDIRAMVDDGNNEEYNLGFGYRALRGDQIGGLHAWLDKRDTSLGSTFYQATIGAELLTYDTDLRFNMYIPITGTKHYTTPNVGSATPYLAGSGIFYDTTGILAEEPQKGLDLEAGYRLPIMQQYVDAFRVYGGGYAFLGNETDDVVGLRTRAQIDVNPWLSVGARLQRDDERGTQGFLEATLRFPVTSKKMIQREGVRARMDESPERDVDIVTGAKQVDTGLAKPVINTETGQIQRVLYVDNSKAAGDGTKENPYNTLKTAEAALQAGDILYVAHGDGTTTNQDKGIVINKDNISLIGSGVNFTYDAGKFAAGGTGADFSGTLLLAAGQAPVITNNDARIDDYTGNGVTILADGALVSGLQVQGAKGIGIYSEAKGSQSQWRSLTIEHNQVNNSTWYGIFAKAKEGATIEQLTMQGNSAQAQQTRSGIAIQIQSGAHISNAVLTNNISKDNLTSNGHGYAITADGIGSALSKLDFSGNSSSGNTAYGLFVGSLNQGNMDELRVADNSMNSNQLSGIALSAYQSGHIAKIQAFDNTTNNNSGGSARGINITASNGVIDELEVRGNAAVNNNLYGIDIEANTSGKLMHALVAENNISANAQVGMRLATVSNGQLSAVVENNEITNNPRTGMLITATGGTATTLNVALSGNSITGNASLTNFDGLRVDDDNTGIFNVDLGGGTLDSTGGNRIYGNSFRDIFIDSRPGTAAGTFGTIISAQHNWWGVATGLDQATRAAFDLGTAGVNGSRIDASSHLTIDPGL